MDAIGKARKSYKDLRNHKSLWSENDDRGSKLETGVKSLMYIAIKGANSPLKLFHFELILDILKQALKRQATNNADVQPVTKAFDKLEMYFILLVDQPWKPEFKKLKMYGGFYRTKIKSVLPEPETIFKLAGYDLDKNKNLLVLKGPVDRDDLLNLAFDCRMATSLCINIEEHYKKLKSLDKTVGDAISDVLYDPAFSALSPKTRTIPTKGVGPVTIQPPALPPKKESPLVNGITEVVTVPLNSLSHQPVQQYQYQVMPPRSAKSWNDSVGNGLLFNSGPPRYQLRAPVPLMDGRVTSSAPPVIGSENLSCISDSNAEILPVLPEGTTEDHMRESLKMVEGQRSSKHIDLTSSEPNSRNANTFDDLAWYHQSHLAVPDGSNRYSALTFPPGVGVKNNAPYWHVDNSLVDEGIGSEISTSSKASVRYNLTADPQSILPNKNPAILQQPSFVDQGYRTGPEPTGHVTLSSRNPSSSSGWPSRTIFHPPQSDLDMIVDPSTLGVQIRQTPVPKMQTKGASMVSVAPPIPPRELKPTYSATPYRVLGQDAVDGPVAEKTTANGGGARTHLNDALRRQGHGLSSIGATLNGTGRGQSDSRLLLAQASDAEPSLRRSRIASSGRSGSLKTGEPRSLLAQEVSQARAAKSMDFTDAAWECQSCTTINRASANVCIVCAHSRLGQDESTLLSDESRNPCPQCTFANTREKTYCEMCNAKLIHNTYSFTN